MVGMFSTLLPLSVLVVCENGGVPMNSATTPVSSTLSVVSARSPILEVPISPVSSVSFSASALSVLLLCLSPVWIGVRTTTTALVLPSETVSLVAHMTVIEETDTVYLHLSTEGCVKTRVVTGAIPFGMESDAYLSAIYSLCYRVAFPELRVEHLPELLHYPQTWFRVWF